MSIVAEKVSVEFGGLRALEDVSIAVRPGRVEALIGPNGAGKSTLLNVLSGFVKPTGGKVYVGDLDLTRAGSHQRALNGIARSFQTPRFVPHMSVEENVLIGFFPRVGGRLLPPVVGTRRHRHEEEAIRDRTRALLEEFELTEVADTPAADVPLWRLRMLEIARAMALDPQYILLDEPAAGFDEQERDLLSRQIARLTEAGVGVLLVEHNFGLIKSVSSHVTVLAQGKFLADGDPAEIDSHPEVVEVYLGKEEH